MKKLFVSQPMRGRSDEEILAERERLVRKVEAVLDEPLEVLPTLFDGSGFSEKNKALQCLAASLRLLAEADVAVFAYGWEMARGCRIENAACIDYGITVVKVCSEGIDDEKQP